MLLLMWLSLVRNKYCYYSHSALVSSLKEPYLGLKVHAPYYMLPSRLGNLVVRGRGVGDIFDVGDCLMFSGGKHKLTPTRQHKLAANTVCLQHLSPTVGEPNIDVVRIDHLKDPSSFGAYCLRNRKAST